MPLCRVNHKPVATVLNLIFDLHIIFIKLIVNLVAYRLHFKIEFEFSVIGNMLLNALNSNKNIYIS